MNTGPNPSCDKPIVLFDGVCGLCNASVEWIVQRDRNRVFRFAPLQGETVEALRPDHPEIPADIESIVLISDGRAYLRSEAALRIAAQLPAPWSLARILLVLPAFLTDLPYRLIARLRYRLWGKLDSCPLPDPDEADRFLP